MCQIKLSLTAQTLKLAGNCLVTGVNISTGIACKIPVQLPKEMHNFEKYS